MATAGKLQNDHLTCSICMEVFKDPVSLACQHSFCKTCLSKYLETQTEAATDKSIPCPSCRQETPVPHPDRPLEEWAGQLKPGLLLTGLMDSLQETVTCFSCQEEGETTPATHWCSECEASFCDVCVRMHRKMPSLRNHTVNNLAEASSFPRVKRRYLCKEHDEKMKLYCKDCKKPLCTVCCSISHRKCEDVVTIQAMLPEVKGQLQERQTKLQKHMKGYRTDIAGYEKEIEKGTDHKAMLKSEIETSFEIILEHSHKMKSQLMKKLEDLSGEQTGQLKSIVKTKQIDLQMYQQQSQFIQQALELEDEAQLFEMYLSSGTGAEPDITEAHRENRAGRATISFIQDLEQVKAHIDKMDVKIEQTYVLDLTAEPVLQEVIEANSHQPDAECDLTDVDVLNVNYRKVIVVTDNKNKIKSFYKYNGKEKCSSLVLDNPPWSVAVLNDYKVAVSVPSSRQIVIVNVNPDLELHSTISTDKQYHGLDVLDQSTLVASSNSPPSVDILDMEGRVIRSQETLPEPHKSFNKPYFIHVTGQGNILVSNFGLKTVTCLSQTGHVVWRYKPTGDRALVSPLGITSTSTGEVFVADRDTEKIILLSKSGEFIRDILTGKDGIENPFGLCVDEDRLYVANQFKGIHVFRFAQR